MSCGAKYGFGKKKTSGYLPSPDEVANEFGRRRLFGRSYFGRSPMSFGNYPVMSFGRYPMFGKKKVSTPPEMGGDENEFGRYVRYGRRRSGFGRRHRRGTRKGRKGSRKGSRKPPAGLRKMCRKYKVKCTRKVGSRRVYKSLSLIKRQLRKKMKSRRRKVGRKTRKVRRGRKGARKTRRRRTMFGF